MVNKEKELILNDAFQREPSASKGMQVKFIAHFISHHVVDGSNLGVY